MEPAFLMLITSLPPSPSSLRVRLWRRLRAIGAVALKRSVYLLPDVADHAEHFQWLAQEIQRDGGEATLVKVDRIENMSRADVIRRFQDARDQDYRQLAARGRKLLRALETKSAARRARVEEELKRLDRDMQRVRDTDFFDAPGHAEVQRLRESLERRLRPSARATEASAALDLTELRGRRWVTRLRPHVDRIASAWLIKRFVDPDATFVFADPRDFPGDAIPFDTAGVELSHQGEDCTFETLLKRTGLRDRRLTRLAEIVHEADLRDGKFARDEARGIDLAIRGLLAALKDDHEALASGLTLFDGLYASVSDRD
jgi:hypothetical protein